MTLAHDFTSLHFTLDDLQAYDAGALAPERAAVVAAHLAAGRRHSGPKTGVAAPT